MAILLKKGKNKIGQTIDRQLRVLFDNSSEFKVCMLDVSGRIIGWNISAERLTGYTSKDVLGKSYSMFISKEEESRNVLKKALFIAAKTGQFTAEGIRVRKDGSHFWARSFITPMKRPNGTVKFFVIITRDVTRERAVEQKREEYIGVASHELKNPITTLSLYSELLARRLELERDKKSLHMLRDIQGQAGRLLTLIDDLLIVGRVEAGTLELHTEVFNANLLLAQVIRDLKRSTLTHKIICKAQLGPQVRADKSRIAQVLVNLIINAVKYSPRSDKVLVRIKYGKQKCGISIQDFGAGIAKKDRRNIFTRYFRAHNAAAGKSAGSGLGLYISKEIMSKHHEKLSLKSKEGRGSTFSFTLPTV